MYYQEGGACSLCGSEGVNKATCPMNPGAKNPNNIKHDSTPCCKSTRISRSSRKVPSKSIEMLGQVRQMTDPQRVQASQVAEEKVVQASEAHLNAIREAKQAEELQKKLETELKQAAEREAKLERQRIERQVNQAAQRAERQAAQKAERQAQQQAERQAKQAAQKAERQAQQQAERQAKQAAQKAERQAAEAAERLAEAERLVQQARQAEQRAERQAKQARQKAQRQEIVARNKAERQAAELKAKQEAEANARELDPTRLRKNLPLLKIKEQVSEYNTIIGDYNKNTSILFWSCQSEKKLCPVLRDNIGQLYHSITCYNINCSRTINRTTVESILSHGDMDMDTERYLIISYPENSLIDWTTEPPVYIDSKKVVEFPVNGGTAYMFAEYMKSIGKKVETIYRSAGTSAIKETVSRFNSKPGKKRIVVIAHNDGGTTLTGTRIVGQSFFFGSGDDNYSDEAEVITDMLNY